MSLDAIRQRFRHRRPDIACRFDAGSPVPESALAEIALTLLGTLDYGPVRVATATMGYKHHVLDVNAVRAGLLAPNYLLKIIPHVDGSARICELVRYFLEDVSVKGAWTGPAGLELAHHALAPVAGLPVLEVISGTHLLCDMTLGLGEVIHDYLA